MSLPTKLPIANLYPIIWRWHFYAGFCVAPFLVVIATSGALLIFRSELERVLYPNILFANPTESRASFAEQLAAAKSFGPNNSVVGGFGVNVDPTRATTVYLRSASGRNQTVYVDPYRGQVLGDETETRFFDWVMRIHRQFLIGRNGSIIKELVTCWTIVLLLSGAYLWWPRQGWRIRGVFLPRLVVRSRMAVRDWHALSGLYAWCVALTIACSGLAYTTLWGSYCYKLAEKLDTALGTRKPPPPPPSSRSATEAADVSADEIVAIARQLLPGASLTVFFPRNRQGAVQVSPHWQTGPTTSRVLFLDRATGEVLEDRSNRPSGFLEWWMSWNYPLHVGSFLGASSKLIWLAACLALIGLPVTGIWMWWLRRPAGQFGAPPRTTAPTPLPLVLVILTLGIMLPMFGISLAAIFIGERIVAIAQKRLDRARS
jgi:uncharacterized iron-regulated membrane protein